jgi:hypothetical protein
MSARIAKRSTIASARSTAIQEQLHGLLHRRILQPSLEGLNRLPGAQHVLLDDLIRAHQHRRRDRQPERFGGLEVDRQLELGRQLNRQVPRFGALP